MSFNQIIKIELTNSRFDFLDLTYCFDEKVFAVHGVGGIMGSILVAVVGIEALGGNLKSADIGAQLVTQFTAVGATACRSYRQRTFALHGCWLVPAASQKTSSA